MPGPPQDIGAIPYYPPPQYIDPPYPPQQYIDTRYSESSYNAQSPPLLSSNPNAIPKVLLNTAPDSSPVANLAKSVVNNIGKGVSAALQSGSSAGSDEMLQQVNQLRTQAGLSPVCISLKLMSSALRHSQYIASIGRPDHARDGVYPDASRFAPFDVSSGTFGENLAETIDGGVRNAGEYIASDQAHRDIVLGSSFTHMGWAQVRGSNGKFYWTQHFAKASGNEPCG